MKTREALRHFSGRHHEHGDGPLARVSGQLLHNFRAKEEARLSAADERSAMAGKGPALAVLQRKLAEAEAQDMFNDSTPCICRLDAARVLRQAKSQHPKDQGLKMAAAHAHHLLINGADPNSYLTLGDVARLRAHYAGQHPRSVVAKVIDTEFPRVGFQTLPVQKLGQIIEQIAASPDRQFAYEEAMRAHGLDTQKPEHRRAQAYVCAMADLTIADTGEPARYRRGEEVAHRALERMAAHDDPILSHVGQMGPGMAPAEAAPPPPIEDEVPHDESTEVIEEATSPITGEPMVVELGAPEADPAMAAEPLAPTDGADELAPEFVASLAYYGQLDDYAEDIPGAAAPEEPIDMIDETPEETSLTLEDPTAPGEMLEVTFQPVEEENPMGGSVAPPMPGMESMAHAASQHVFSVFAVCGGQIPATPLERVRTVNMHAVIRRIARQLRADGPDPTRVVLADRQRGHSEAVVVLDGSLGNYLLVRAEADGGAVMSPAIVTEGQPVVQHNLQLSESQGREVLVEEKDLSQNVPAQDSSAEYEVKAKKLTAKQVRLICRKMGLTAKKIEAALLEGRDVVVGNARLTLTGEDDVTFYRGDRGRQASLYNLDTVIRDFMAYAATVRTKRRQASFRVRPHFTVGCVRCGALGEYQMPDEPADVKCASCDWTTPPEAIAIQLETRQATAFPGYTITADIPGRESDQKHNARRILSAIKQIAQTDGALIRQGQLEFVVRGINEAGLNRIRRVLEDTFGVRDAQMAPAAVPPVNMMGQPTQHATPPVAPPAPQMMQAPTGQPQNSGGGVQQIGAEGQEAFIEEHADPLKGVGGGMPQAASHHLPVGPGIKHVHVQYESGNSTWLPIEAASDVVVRQMIASYMDGSQVLEIRDSRQAQMPAMPPPGGEEEGPAEQMGLEMSGPQGGESIESAGVDPKTEETIRAAMMHYRNTGVGIAEATDSFVSNYSRFLDRYGDKTSPARHLVEATVIRIAKETFEKPALVEQQSPVFAALDRKRGWHLQAARYLNRLEKSQRAGAWTRISAEEPKGPKPKQINQQQDDWVNLGEGDAVLGPDSTTGEGFDDPKVNQQQDTIALQPGSEGADTSQQPDTSSRDPKRFDAPKPDSGGSVHTPPGSGWGTAYTDDDFGSQGDSQTGENGETQSWDGVADGANSNVRSK